MAVQESVALRTAKMGVVETTVGASPKFNVYTGTQPSDCATAASGTLIATGTLPSDWLAAASAGAVAKTGTWTITGNASAGTGTTMGYFRITDNAGTTTHFQGSIGVGSGDFQVDNASIANTQVLTVSSWTLTSGNA